MPRSRSHLEKDDALIRLSKSYQLLAQSSGCLPRDHFLKPKFEEIMGDLEAEIAKTKNDPERTRQRSTSPMSMDPPASLGLLPSTTDPKVSSSPSPNIARPKPERRPTAEFFPPVVKKQPLTGFTPQKDSEIQNRGRRKQTHSRGTHSRPSRVEKKRKPPLTKSQKKWRRVLNRMN
ncbi:hypothetical protein NW768_010048 [Fusarium equiseti]|uniref:Uncharacterized protein n=1 Tax=Fusarium equiseti TaxID=61235 RepID=A0ABQ8R1L8_FUSEQ|nr:hypothetical protein NW768_010048 [Fusarium equiseti]